MCVVPSFLCVREFSSDYVPGSPLRYFDWNRVEREQKEYDNRVSSDLTSPFFLVFSPNMNIEVSSLKIL